MGGLAAALLLHSRQTQPVARVQETSFGPSYEVEGKLNAPGGHSPRLRTVWQWDRGTVAPRLITAYPLKNFLKIKEHDCVVLTAGLSGEGLEAGDVGTVVHVHKGGMAYEVEFVTLAGNTIAVVTMDAGNLRPVGKRDVNHVRELQLA